MSTATLPRIDPTRRVRLNWPMIKASVKLKRLVDIPNFSGFSQVGAPETEV